MKMIVEDFQGDRATTKAFTGRFLGRGTGEAVILSAAKDLRSARREILRCAQDDSL